MNQVIIPENYHSVLSMYETQDAIGIIKEMMQKKLCMALRLKRVTAPLFVDPASLRFSCWKGDSDRHECHPQRRGA